MLSMSYLNLFTMSSLQTALDAPLLVFFSLTGTCSLNHKHHYDFGLRHPSAKKILRNTRIIW